jgi:hypothetical protein
LFTLEKTEQKNQKKKQFEISKKDTKKDEKIALGGMGEVPIA